jgi:hypothetical protein
MRLAAGLRTPSRAQARARRRRAGPSSAGRLAQGWGGAHPNAYWKTSGCVLTRGLRAAFDQWLALHPPTLMHNAG